MKKPGCVIKILLFCLLLGMAFAGCGIGEDRAESAPGADIPPEEAQGNHTGLYPASVNGIGGYRWGYIDKEGSFVIKPGFAVAEDFQDNGLAIVLTGDLMGENHAGIINTAGKFVVKDIYDYITGFSDGIAIAMGKDGMSAINESGKTIFESRDYISPFHDGLAVFSRTVESGAWQSGYIDTVGNVAIEPKYDLAGDFKDGKAIVRSGDTDVSMIDKRGNTLHRYPYAYVGELGDGLLPFKENDKYGYIDEAGRAVIPPRFSEAEAFKNGMAVVNTSEDYANNLFGVIDKKGKYIIQPEFNDIQYLGEDRFAVGNPIDKEFVPKGSIYAIADKSGKFLTGHIYYGVTPYKNGYASAYDNTTTFFIDKTGKKVPELPVVEGIGTLSMEGELIRKDVDDRISWFDKSGKLIWKPETDVPLRDGIVVKEFRFRPNRNYLAYYPQLSGMAKEMLQLEINEKLKRMSIDTNVSGDAELDFNYQGEYSVDFFKKNLLGLRFTGYNYPFGAAHGMPDKRYAYIDLTDGTFYRLKDLFKQNSPYVEKLSDIVKKQIESQGEDSSIWLDSYKGIQDDQPFRLAENALTIYFTPYEIAPYAAGFPEFTIPFEDIMDIINTKGSFWQSFN